MDRFADFTDAARKVVTLAHNEAHRLDHNYIGTEHLLLGVVREESSVGAKALHGMGVELVGLRAAVERAAPRGRLPVVGEVGLTPPAKRLIVLAIDEARRLGDGYIGPEHLLLGLVRHPSGVAADVLTSLGVDLDRVRHEVIRLVMEREIPDSPLEFARAKVEVEESPLERAVAIGLAGANGMPGDVLIELTALELRAAGANLHWKAHSRTKPLGRGIDLRVSDDLETQYRTWSSWWTGSGNEARGEILIVPAPPDGAAVMQLELRVFSTGGTSQETSLRGEISLRD
ncbi:MAG TPA: Clp protease N-terminal domain-containing protein [Candidatus Limnocylindrales bacterium]